MDETLASSLPNCYPLPIFSALLPSSPIPHLPPSSNRNFSRLSWTAGAGVVSVGRRGMMPGSGRQITEKEEDIFASTVDLEGSHLQQGFDDGFRDGVELGKVEGREVGLKTGFELGEEIGLFRGCVDIWSAVLKKEPSAFSPRAQRNIRVFDKQLQDYPLQNPHDERLQESLDSLRSKFRLIMSLLSIQVDYKGLAKVDQSEESLF